MKITCPKCKTKLVFPDEKLTPGQTRIKCSKCGAVLIFKRKAAEPPPETLPINQTGIEPQTPVQQDPAPYAAAPRTEPRNEIQPVPMPGPSPDEIHPEDTTPGVADVPMPEPQEIKKVPLKTEAAQETVKKHLPPPPPPEIQSRRLSGKAGLIAAAAGLSVLGLILLFVFISGPSAPKQQPVTASPAGGTSGVQSPDQAPAVQAAPPASKPPDTSQTTASSPPYFDMTEETAIDIVKKSDALLKRTPVEAIVNKWAEDNAARFKIVGWQGKKIDEQKYMVSYTALNGEKPTGFYFEVDARTGAVQDIGRNPELQKQYNIQYNR